MTSPNLNSIADGPRESSKDSVPRLSVRGISKSFETNQVLAGIDLDVYEGEVVALLGENGAGLYDQRFILEDFFAKLARFTRRS